MGSGLTVAGDIDQTTAVDLVLRADVLHHVYIVHGSEPNRSASKRIGVAIRYVAPDVSQALEHHVVVLARGRDTHHHYELLDKAPTGSMAEGIAAQAALRGDTISAAPLPCRSWTREHRVHLRALAGRAAFEDLETRLGRSQHYVGLSHLFVRWAYDLATDPVVLDASV